MTEAPFRYICLSNALSYVSLSFGLSAIFVARQFANWEGAGLLLALAALADTFDGKFARCFRRTPFQEAFGIQLDSLVDAVCFGVAPIVCLSVLVEAHSGTAQLLWMAASALHVLCAVTRLGFYNVHHRDTPGFVGLPTTAAAILWATLFLFHPATPMATVGMAVIGVAMICPLYIPRPRGALMAAYLLWIGIVVARAGIVLTQDF
jgi:CDP-diacylglycerol---serine O-phosphatidyltransferase